MGQEISKITQKMCMKSSLYKVLLLGLEGSGKTTLFDRLKFNEVYVRHPTIGFHAETFPLNTQDVTFWDFGGNEKIMKLWQHYFEHTDLVIIVIDSTDKNSIDELKNMFQLIKEKLKEVYIMIMLNKTDLPNPMTNEEFTSMIDLYKYDLKICKMIRTSLVKGTEIKEIKKTISHVLLKKDIK